MIRTAVRWLWCSACQKPIRPGERYLTIYDGPLRRVHASGDGCSEEEQ